MLSIQGGKAVSMSATMEGHKVVSREEWLKARKTLLLREKALSSLSLV